MLDKLPEVGDIIVFKLVYCYFECTVTKAVESKNLVFIEPYREWFTLEDLNLRKAVIVGKVKKFLWFTTKKYF